ncbi:ANTAR domain-containing protein [Pseudonocardia lutea]|uniref:ANTAR domain-containing protein n=1 Tax=Pseudonocardia lutea TaxID=2172015 RepID=A0ABW1I828_9PSEU
MTRLRPTVRPRTAGRLDVYLDRRHDRDDTEVDALGHYAAVLETVLVATLSARRATTLAGQHQHALDSRILVDRAIGFLMGRADLDAATAFTLLRRSARSQRRRLADVCPRGARRPRPATPIPVVNVSS